MARGCAATGVLPRVIVLRGGTPVAWVCAHVLNGRWFLDREPA
jgi:hypothetical protein